MSADVDSDGDLDLIAVSPDGPYWMENLDEQGAFGQFQMIGARPAYRMALEDLDGDGDVDLIATIDDPDAIAMFQK